MTETQLAVNLALLAPCALLRWFDDDLLGVLTECAEDEIRDLLDSPLVVSTAECAGAYSLCQHVQAEVLARVQTEPLVDDLTLHARAFDYFLRRMEQPQPGERRLADEAACFYHLSKLRELLAQRREWRTIAAYTEAVRAAHPRQPRHQLLVTLYEGLVAINTQDYERGETLLVHVLDQPDLDNDDRMLALRSLGHGYWFQTRWDRALACYQQYYALARAAGDRFYQASALLNMSMTYKETGYYEQALELSTQSLALFREAQDRPGQAHALWEAGQDAMHLGRWHDARRAFHEAIQLYQALGIVAPLANLFWCEGFLHHLLGDEAASEASYREALSIAQSAEHGDPTAAMDALLWLGFLYQTQDRWDEAMDRYEQALAVARQVHSQYYLAAIQGRRGDVLARQGRPEAALAAYAQAIDGIEALRGVTEQEEIKIGVLGTTQHFYEAIVRLCLERQHVARAFEYVERARSQAFLDKLVRKSPELYERLDQPVTTLAEVQARLPADALLLEYFTTGVLPRGEHLLNRLPPENERLREHLTLPPQIIIFAVTRDGCEVHQAALNPNSLRPQIGDPGPGRSLLHDHLLRHLQARLIEPVGHLLPGKRLLYLVPHGPLHYVPFMALRRADGRYLLDGDGPAIALAPSATILVRNCLGRPPSRADGVLALGYDDQAEAMLCHAETEARRVAHLVGGQAWTGPRPKSQRLLAAGLRLRWLHFAGHAVFNPHDPLDSALRLGADDTLSARAIIDGLDLCADLVTLSACTSGLSHVVPGDELLGLPRAFLYAGAPTVVCTLWEAADLAALLVMEQFYTRLLQGQPAAAALRDAQVAVRQMSGRALAAAIARRQAEDPAYTPPQHELALIASAGDDGFPFADPFYWAPFMLIGRPS